MDYIVYTLWNRKLLLLLFIQLSGNIYYMQHDADE